MDEKKNKKDINGKLSTYVVVMLLSTIIIIIIAAMADNREQKFQSQIETTTQANMTIQNEIVTLKDENYRLEQENKTYSQQLDEFTKNENVYNIISQAINLYNEGKEEEAVAKFNEIDPASVSEGASSIYETIKAVITGNSYTKD